MVLGAMCSCNQQANDLSSSLQQSELTQCCRCMGALGSESMS